VRRNIEPAAQCCFVGRFLPKLGGYFGGRLFYRRNIPSVITNGAYADTHPHADPLDLISSAAFKGLDEKNGARVTHCEPA
jgi:hypothetical protein